MDGGSNSLTPIKEAGKIETGRVTSLKSVSIYLKLYILYAC